MSRLTAIAAATLVLAAAPPAFAAPPADVIRASVVAGDELDNANGWQIARVEDVLLDPEDDSVSFLVLRVGSRFEAPGGPVALSLPDPDLSVVEGHLRTKKSIKQLRNLPSLESALDSLDEAKRKRLLGVEPLLDASVRTASGAAVGEVGDIVFHPASGALGYVVVERPGSSFFSTKEIAIAQADVRATQGGEAAQVVVDDAQLASARPVDESSPELQSENFWHRLARRFGLA